MTIHLTSPLKWTAATHEEQSMLCALQGNILKGHGRDHTTNLFFRLDPAKAQQARSVLRELANYHVTNAFDQLQETAVFKETGKPGKTFVALFLSHSGYTAIGRPDLAPTGQPTFINGMRDPVNAAAIGDDTANWEAGFNQQIDGLVLIGDETLELVKLRSKQITDLLDPVLATKVHEQLGAAVRNSDGEGIEHFGYVDGRSQPILLTEDIEHEAKTAGIDRWDPKFALNSALVNEDAAAGAKSISYGSYFIFRKLEQDVHGFKRKEQELASLLGLTTAETREIAGAKVVGRFEDGTPVTLSDEARGLKPPNNFNYSGDAAARCPFQAHIRKVNPRSSDPTVSDKERTHIMPRRGIPFTDTERAVHPSNIPGSNSMADFDAIAGRILPTGGVGLLFMAYNANLTEQFVFSQKSWANSKNFPSANVGIDPIIGQGGPTVPPIAQWREGWDDTTSTAHGLDFRGFVTMRGGEYFFAPSLTTLKNL